MSLGYPGMGFSFPFFHTRRVLLMDTLLKINYTSLVLVLSPRLILARYMAGINLVLPQVTYQTGTDILGV
jgi:hypothetical protein